MKIYLHIPNIKYNFTFLSHVKSDLTQCFKNAVKQISIHIAEIKEEMKHCASKHSDHGKMLLIQNSDVFPSKRQTHLRF